MKIKHYRVWVENNEPIPHDGSCRGTRCGVCGCCLHCFHECSCTYCSCSEVTTIEEAIPVGHIYEDETEVESS